MAFNMNRSIIKGTKLHKSSMAKAKRSVVSQDRMQADRGLVEAGRNLGESNVGGAIDFGLDTKADLDFKREKQKQGDYVLGCMDSTANNYSAAATKDDGNCTYDEVVGTGSVSQEDLDIMNSGATIDFGDGNGDGNGDGGGDGTGTSNYVDEEEDADYTDEDIEADLARIGDEDGVDGQPTEFTNEQWELEQQQEALRAANEIKANLDAESRRRSNEAYAALSILPSRSVNSMPTTNNSTPGVVALNPADINSQNVIPAHLDKNYSKNTPKANKEFNNLNLNTEQDVHDEYYTNLGVDPMGVKNSHKAEYNGYEYSRVVDENGVEHDMWSYNNQQITDDQVGTKEYTALMSEVAEMQKKEYEQELLKKEQNLNSNTPKTEPTETELLPQPPTESTNNTEITEKPRMSDFEGNWFERAAQYKEAMRAYKEKYDVNYKMSPTQKRVKSKTELKYDKIFKNAVPGGIAQQTMLKIGYKNK